jgi:hypothetical protein
MQRSGREHDGRHHGHRVGTDCSRVDAVVQKARYSRRDDRTAIERGATTCHEGRHLHLGPNFFRHAIRWPLLAAAALLMLGTAATWAAPLPARQVESLDEQWHFLREDVPAAGGEDFDDSAWTLVTLPHTWNAEDGAASNLKCNTP